jgi:hypothetical protein
MQKNDLKHDTVIRPVLQWARLWIESGHIQALHWIHRCVQFG